MADENGASSGRNWVSIGGWLSVGYLAVLALSVWPLTHIGMLTFSAALSPNELGDALAGIFAPLAFLWLFVATMVQSQELSLQRKELALSREVSSEQAAEAKKTAEFIGAQTALMKHQVDRVDQQAQTMMLDAKVETFASFLDGIGTGPYVAFAGIGYANLPARADPLRTHRDLIHTAHRHLQWLHDLERAQKQG